LKEYEAIAQSSAKKLIFAFALMKKTALKMKLMSI